MNAPAISSQPGRKVAILVTDGFEQIELTSPRDALQQAGAQTLIVAPKNKALQGFNHDEKADTFEVDVVLGAARAEDFDVLLLPGGVINADALRTDEQAQAFARAFDEAGKPIAVICHGAWLLIDAGLVQGRTVTSWPSLATDLRNAGATWVDKEVCVDGRWVSSRKPDDLPAFNAKLLECVR
ncbi:MULTISPECIES: type 1 glutamine amidotransferase domain-containing protein [unclassified Acidovorax]|uniref:type 1 glutamine amidotransferase domain-containing protein n=1 Tax=unclassified Acidovorax TaxID=2684926 RepID=UPI002882FDB0|nr:MULTISPECIES: type 1 glutamine amidotransferase domain-containing protein [unclassified Acidovorax]